MEGMIREILADSMPLEYVCVFTYVLFSCSVQNHMLTKYLRISCLWINIKE